MKKLNKIKWYTKFVLIGLALVVVLNPLSLILISTGIDLAVTFIGDLLQRGVELGTEYAIYPMGLGAVLTILGGGAWLGAREKSNTAKLKNLKNKPTQKAGKYLEA